MILSTKGRYGLKMILQIALVYGHGSISLKDIAKKQKLSETYLEQLIAYLRKAGYVNSIRGAQGGYTLAKPPSEIKVGDIIRTLEGPLAPAQCVVGEESECNQSDCCVTRVVWEKIMNSINQVVDSITLQDMIDDYNRMNINKEGAIQNGCH